MMSPADTELVDFLNDISFDEPKDWRDKPELGLDPEDDDVEDEEDRDE